MTCKSSSERHGPPSDTTLLIPKTPLWWKKHTTPPASCSFPLGRSSWSSCWGWWCSAGYGNSGVHGFIFFLNASQMPIKAARINTLQIAMVAYALLEIGSSRWNTFRLSYSMLCGSSLSFRGPSIVVFSHLDAGFVTSSYTTRTPISSHPVTRRGVPCVGISGWGGRPVAPIPSNQRTAPRSPGSSSTTPPH